MELVLTTEIRHRTPKEFANFSPGLPQPWEMLIFPILNSEGVGELLQSWRCNTVLVARLKQPWAEIGKRLRRSSSVKVYDLALLLSSLPHKSHRMLKVRNSRAVLFVLLVTGVVSTTLPAQEKRPGNVQKTTRVVPTDEKTETSKQQQRRKVVKEITENVFLDARTILNPVVRTKIRTLSADAYWHFRPQTARQILRDEFSALESLDTSASASPFWIEKDGKTNYKGMPAEHVKAQLRRELLATAGVYDPAFFRELLASERKNETSTAAQPDQQLMTASETDRLVGSKHYLTDPARMLDAKRMVEFGSEILYRRIQSEVPANMSAELVKREYYLWRNLQTVFEDVNPNNLWLVNTRLRQLAATLPPTTQRPTQGPWSEDRLKTLLAAAEQSSGEKRDNYLSAAATTTWRFGEGDLDKAIALTEKISDPKLRDDTAGIIYMQAGAKYLRSEGPDYALELARKINLPGPRVRLFLAVVSSLEVVKATERIDSLRRELLNWLRNCERNSDTAWAMLDYLDGSTSSTTEDRFAAFELLVRVLNSPNLESGGTMKNRVYWHPEFHDFRKTLAPLVQADFNRALALIQMLNNREISLQVQAAFCAVYFKRLNKNGEARKPAI